MNSPLLLTHGAAGDPRTGRAVFTPHETGRGNPSMTNKTRIQIRTGLLLLAAFAIYTALGLALILR